MGATHTAGRCSFDLFGNSPHLCIRTAGDLAHAAALDEAHWVATSAPVDSFNCDPVLLRLLDANSDGRIACHDLKTAIRWLLEALSDHTGITSQSPSLELATIAADSPDGKTIRQAAEKVLQRLGCPDAQAVTLEQIRKVKSQVESSSISEAGVVLPEATTDPRVQGFLKDVTSCTGGTPHPSGANGVAAGTLDSFTKTARAYLEWQAKGQIPEGVDHTETMPLGQATPEAFAALSAVRAKLDQFFAQCEASVLDERFVQRMGWTDSELQDLDFDDPEVISQVLAKAPIAQANTKRLLDPTHNVNPHYADAVATFMQQVAGAVLTPAPTSLSAAQWQEIKTCFATYEAWLSSKTGDNVAGLGTTRLAECLDPELDQAVRTLIAESAKTAIALDSLRAAEKLALYQASLIPFANNFVSFPLLYNPARRAMFEMGSLVMDGCRFNLAVRVTDRAQHEALAKNSSMFVLYITAKPTSGGAEINLALPVTSGNKGNLCVGKRGVFYDLEGREYDAKVVQIIENPISFVEALATPFIRVGRLLTGKIEALTTTSSKKLEEQTNAAWGQVAADQPKAPVPQSQVGASGMVMGAGVAAAALGSATAYIAKTLAETSWVSLVAGIVGAILLVLLPTAFVAFLKLRRRDISAILEGAGWAINARMRLNKTLGKTFTARPSYPKHARGIRRLFWRRVLVALLALLLLGEAVYLVRQWRTITAAPVALPVAK